jgi:CRP-like cAMP-binding protein
MKHPSQHEILSVSDREIVFREGDESTEMFVIRSGRVEILKDVGGHQIHLALLERGSFFGEMSLLEGLPRSATARAIGSTTLLVLRPGTLLMQIRKDPTFAFELLQQLSGRIRELNDKLVFKLATAEFDNRLARSAFRIRAAAEVASSRDAAEVKETR